MATDIIAIVFVVAGVGALWQAFSIDAAAQSAMHQIYAALWFVVGAVFLVGGVLLGKLREIKSAISKPPPSDTLKISAPLVKLSDQLEELAADVAWFKDLKAKDIARARTASQPPSSSRPPAPPREPPRGKRGE